MATTANHGQGALAAFERNHFFYGKLMDVVQCEKEQNYFIRKRWLLNRLVLGSGVVCGLDVVAHGRDMIRIQPGLAIDGLGREIVVPQAVPVPPRQLTDDQGKPTGKHINDGTVNLSLGYAESKTDPVPALVADCDTPDGCAPNTIREEFRVLVRGAEGNPPVQPICTIFGQFPLPAGEALHDLLCQRIDTCDPARINSSDLEALPADPCVHLAQITIGQGDGGITIDPYTGRRLVYNNALLYEMILCLAERVQELRLTIR